MKRVAILAGSLLLGACQYQTVKIAVTGNPSAVAAQPAGVCAVDAKAKAGPQAPGNGTATASPGAVTVNVSQAKPVEVSPGRELSPKGNTVPVGGGL